MAATPTPPGPGGKAVNWNTPSAADVVQKAVEAGITDPAKIAEYAKQRFQLDLPHADIAKHLPQKPTH